MPIPAVQELPEDPVAVSRALEGLIERDALYLARNPHTPHPYAAGVRYRWEHPGAHWWDVGEVMRAGWGDCKDLAAWLAAWYRTRHGVVSVGLARFPRVVIIPTGPGKWHAILEHVCGCKEDPSAVLGMPPVPLPAGVLHG